MAKKNNQQEQEEQAVKNVENNTKIDNTTKFFRGEL